MDAWARGAMDRMSPLIRPRRRGADHSMARGIAAEYSPATNTPPARRSSRMRTRVAAPSVRWVGMHAMARLHPAVPAMARRVVRVRPSRSATLPSTTPPTGRPRSMAMTTSASAEALAVGPATVARAGDRAIKGRKTWMLSIQLPTTPASSAARPAGGSCAGGELEATPGALSAEPALLALSALPALSSIRALNANRPPSGAVPGRRTPVRVGSPTGRPEPPARARQV